MLTVLLAKYTTKTKKLTGARYALLAALLDVCIVLSFIEILILK